MMIALLWARRGWQMRQEIGKNNTAGLILDIWGLWNRGVQALEMDWMIEKIGEDREDGG